MMTANQLPYEFNSPDEWLTDALKGFDPAAYVIDPMLLERNVSRGLSAFDRLFQRRRELNQLFVARVTRDLLRVQEASNLTNDEAIAISQLQHDEAGGQSVAQRKASTEFGDSVSSDPLAAALATQADGTSTSLGLRAQKDSDAAVAIRERFKIARAQRDARVTYEDAPNSAANLETHISNLAALYLQDIKEALGTLHAIRTGQSLLSFPTLPEVPQDSPDLVWRMAANLRISARWLEIESRFRVEQTLVISLTPTNPPSEPDFPHAPDPSAFAGPYSGRLGINYNDYSQNLSNGGTFNFSVIEALDLPNHIRPRMLSIGVTADIILGPQNNTARGDLAAATVNNREIGLRNILPVRLALEITPPGYVEDPISRGNITISNAGDLADRPNIAGESGPKVEVCSFLGKWQLRVLPVVMTRRGSFGVQLVCRLKGYEYTAPEVLRRGVVFVDGLTLHVRVSAVDRGRADELKAALDDALSRMRRGRL